MTNHFEKGMLYLLVFCFFTTSLLLNIKLLKLTGAVEAIHDRMDENLDDEVMEIVWELYAIEQTTGLYIAKDAAYKVEVWNWCGSLWGEYHPSENRIDVEYVMKKNTQVVPTYEYYKENPGFKVEKRFPNDDGTDCLSYPEL